MSADQRALEAAVRSLGRRFDRLESEVVAPLAASVELLHKRVADDEEAEGRMEGHRPWRCSACRALLGFYDEAGDVMRVRVKDYHLRFHAGSGGWAEVPCRRCGQPNRVEDPSPARG